MTDNALSASEKEKLDSGLAEILTL